MAATAGDGQGAPRRIGRPPLDRCRGALVGVAVGDALGAPFEGRPGPVPPAEVDAALGGDGPRRYTDDTAMALALARSLLARGGVDEDHLAAAFADEHRRDPDRGYGAGARRLLAAVAAGADWRDVAAAQFGGQGSYGNGAAMRVAPVALAADGPDHAAELARRSARPTHAHPVAQDGAAVQAAAVALLLRTPDGHHLEPARLVSRLTAVAETREVGERLRAIAAAHRTGALDATFVVDRIGTGVGAAEAVPAAVACVVLHPTSFADVVRTAIGLGGDTDTIAAMAGAMAGAALGEAAIPARWRAAAEGVPALRDLADALWRRAPAADPPPDGPVTAP